MTLNDPLMEDTLCLILRRDTSPEALLTRLGALDPAEWQSLVTLARQHQVCPLFWQRLNTLPGQVALPDTLADSLQQEHLFAAVRGTLMLHHAAGLLQALATAAVDVIVLKGAYLAEAVYQDISLRSFGDIDLMVKKESLSRAFQVARGLGYQDSGYFDPSDANRDIKHLPTMFGPDGLPLELHWTILEEDEPFTIDSSDLWQRAVPARVSGAPTLALGAEDLLLHLCLHLTYQHRLKLGLKGLVDIDRVIANVSETIDWQKTIAIAHHWGARRVAWLSLSLARDILGTPIPAETLATLQPVSESDWALREARAFLLQNAPASRLVTPDLAVLEQKKSFFARAALILSRVFLPRPALARVYGVSPRSPRLILCYFRRFFDLLKTYSRSLFSIWRKDKDLIQELADEENLTALTHWMTAS